MYHPHSIEGGSWRLECCGVTDEGCAALISSLRSNSSHLRELDLSKNYLRDSGVKSLSAGLENPHCKLETLKLCDCGISGEGCAALTSALRSNPSHLRKLDLSENKLTDSGVKSLSAVLENPHCKLETLRLRGCEISGEGCAALTSALISNPSHMRELNLSWNKLTDSGVKSLSAVLVNPHCKLDTLRLCDCGISGEGCAALTSALISNPSHLRKLDLSWNYLRDSGVESLSAVLENPHCKLVTLSRGGRRVHRQREKRKGKSVGLRIGTLNVGTMTGKGRELADMMERRKVDILSVQETRWKGSKARSIGAGFKLFYYGVDSKRNGVGVVLKEEFVRNILEVKRVSDRVMSLKLEIEGVMLNVVSGYAPQVGCELEEKERFWSELDEVMESIPTGERVVMGADFNGHVGEGNTGDEEVIGKFGVKERNLEGQMVVDFAKRMDMAVVNTYFQKREEHRVTYKSGGRSTQVDYILCRRGNLKEISDCKVVVGESVARQHRMVVCRMTLMVCKKKRSEIEIEKKTKWWKLKKEECCEEFRQKLRQALGGQVLLPDDWETTAEVIRETGRKVLGVSSGRRKEDKETWWWNEEVQDSIQRKRLAKKKWDMDRTEENRQEYKELQRRVKREVSKAKQKAYDELYTRLDTREGQKDLFRLARQRDQDGKDVQQVRVIKDRDGRVLTSEESVQRRWKEYFEELMNEENERVKRVEGVNSVEQKVDKIRKDEVRKALKRMKSGKAVGPDDIPVEVWKCLGEAAVEFLASLFNRVLESEKMPEEWRRSVLVPIFKNKGDVQSCSNYRGIKLMSHTMKVWERVVEARLRKVVEICEQQYGFMPRKSTTDAIFALRILMEKYRDGQRELHCVFVDLEKAYDRVPREELWYCMRKSGVAEKYVRVVQDMYERSRTVVRCAVGQTEEFNVEVGLHQGSALSPFLFAIVMDQLSEEVRQESPWTMMFADDIVICSESTEQVEENLERWRFALERRGMKVSRSKTEYMCVNEREGSGTVRLQSEEVKKVQEFKYLGSTVQSNGECGKEVKKRVQAGWNEWRKVSGVLCDQKISARIKGKVYRTVVRAAMLYGLETVSLRLCSCEISDEGCSALTSALISNPSHLRELDLSWNNLTDSGVKSLSAVLENPHCKLDTLSFRGGAAPLVASGGEFRQHLAPDRPPLGEFQTSARRTSSPRSRRSSVDIARCECSTVDVARSCCSAVDVAWSCGSAVDVIRLCGSAVDVIRLCGSAVDLVRRFRSAVDVASDPLALPSGPLLPPLVSLLLLTPSTCLALILVPPTCLALILVPPTCLALVLASPHSPCFCFSLPPQVPRPAPRSPHRPLYVPSSSPGPLAGPDFLGGAREQLLVFSDVGDTEAGVPACGGGHGGIPQ
ncbi:hypothetical protein QTP70_000997 [Hemibagrus guttatus]|uniref:ribonuclease H n=1 Tax=Hemibagrus guttatus TaxID=175788 RepID=A0AAE0PSB5_9TELE|nr:hypothetical protein QTP70_000997 [Hemibagrus guttatus]